MAFDSFMSAVMKAATMTVIEKPATLQSCIRNTGAGDLCMGVGIEGCNNDSNRETGNLAILHQEYRCR